MVQIGKVYHLYFGNDIFVDYIVVDATDDECRLINMRRTHYAGACNEVIIKKQSLNGKNTIYDWRNEANFRYD